MSLPAGLRSQLLQHARVRSFRRGSWIYVQGDPPRGLWAVVEGEISFTKLAQGGHEIVYHVAGAGFWFGVFGVISGTPLNMAVTALSDTKLLFVPRRAVDEIVDREPRYALQLLRLTFTRASELIELVSQITRPSPRARVASRLLMLQATEAEHAARQPVSVLHISQLQLAAMTALSRQSVSRAVGELHAAGAIEPGFRQITISDAERLRQFADGAD